MVPLRLPSTMSILDFPDLDFQELRRSLLTRPQANWVRLMLLVVVFQSQVVVTVGATFSPSLGSSLSMWILIRHIISVFSLASARFLAVFPSWTFTVFDFGSLSPSLLCLASCLFVLYSLSADGAKALGPFKAARPSLFIRLILLFVLVSSSAAMEPSTAAERARAASRANDQLIASRTVRTETRTNRDIALTWNGILRIGEVLLAHRREIVLPGDSAPGIEFLLLRIQAPKTRGRAAKHQAARVDPVDVIQLISAVFRDLQPDQLLWPLSAATLRKRFVMLLKAVGIRFDLGSLRPGGATHLLLQTEDPELCRRRGRWLSTRVMEIYLQEVMATTFVQRLDHTTQLRISKLGAAFPQLLAYALSFLSTAIPPNVWPHLFHHGT